MRLLKSYLSWTERCIGFSGDGEPCPGGRGSAATRMVTRLRNPESKLSQMKSQQVAAAVHEANKVFKEGKEVRIVSNTQLKSMPMYVELCNGLVEENWRLT